MRLRTVAILGGGVAGMSTALLLARDGHTVTVVERDRVEVGDPLDAPSWTRRGIPHFLQPHAFIPRGRLELRQHLPDVYDGLIAAGAGDVDLRRKIPGPVRREDGDLQYLAVRRPLIEWGLRRAVVDEPRIHVLDRVEATGIAAEGGRISGVQIGGAVLGADLVVDALGRRTPTGKWLDSSGFGIEQVEDSRCGVVYFCRYYRLREGHELPDGPWLLSPRGDLGYMAYATFPGDNRTFGAVLAVPPGVGELRPLKDPRAFEAAVAQIPLLRMWVDPDGVDPITDVLPMAGLRNSLRHVAPVVGFVPVGDALSHTDPVLAHGLAFALVHAASLTTALRDHAEVADAGADYAAAVVPALRERFALATDLDAQRYRMWVGEKVDFAHPEGAYALFTVAAAGAAALVDPEIFRVFVRRMGLLDSTAVLDADEAMQRRIEDVFQQMLASPRPPPGPPRDEMIGLVAEAVA